MQILMEEILNTIKQLTDESVDEVTRIQRLRTQFGLTKKPDIFKANALTKLNSHWSKEQWDQK